MIYIFRKEMKKWHSVLWVVLASLVVGGLVGVFFRQKHPGEIAIAKVNGSDITVKKYGQTLSEIKSQIEAYRAYARMYGIPIDMFLSISGFNNPEQAAYDRCINDELVDQQLSYFKLEISPEYFEKELLEKLPANLKDESGNLNMEAYQFHLGRMFSSIPEFEESKEQEFRRELFGQFIERANYVPDRDLIETFAQDTIKKKFAILEFAYNKYLDNVKKSAPTKEEQEGFYKKHKEYYRVPEKRQAVYWQISPEKYSAKIDIDEDAIQNFYDKNKSTLFRIPPKVKVRNILLKLDANVSPEKLDKTLSLAREIHKELKADGSKFVDFVKKYSEDEKTKSKDGLIDFFEKGTIDKDFETAAFRLLKEGEISDIVKTAEGYQIIQLVERVPADYKPIEKVKDEIIKTIKAKKEQIVLKSALERAMHEQKTNKSSITSFVKNNNLNEEKTGLLTQEDAGGKDLTNRIAEKLFFSKKKKNVFGYFIYQKNYIIYEMIDSKDSYIPDFADVEKNVLTDYYNEKAKQLMKKDVSTARSEIFSKAKDFAKIKDEFSLNLIETDSIKKGDDIKGLDFGKNLSEKAFILDDAGQILAYKNNSDTYLVQLVDAEKVDLEKFQNEKIKILEKEKSNSDKLFLSAFIASLLRNAKIENMQKMPNINVNQ